MQVVRTAVGQVNFAMENVRVRAGCRAVKGPLELPESHRQAAQGHVALGPRIAQPPGLGRQVRRHGRQQMQLVEDEGLAQLQPQRAPGSLGAW